LKGSSILEQLSVVTFPIRTYRTIRKKLIFSARDPEEARVGSVAPSGLLPPNYLFARKSINIQDHNRIIATRANELGLPKTTYRVSDLS
jgi:hypothetical protein